MEPLGVEVIKDIHRKVIDKGSFEEQALRESVRDEGTLYHIATSAEKITDPVAKAAFLLHRMATQHPFIEGNKRTAWGIATTLLRIEGYYLDVEDDLIDVYIRKVASGMVKEKEIEKWLKERMRSFTE